MHKAKTKTYTLLDVEGEVLKKGTKEEVQEWKENYIDMLIDTGEFEERDRELLQSEFEVVKEFR